MHCPQCQKGKLAPVELEPRLVVAQCDSCCGNLIPLLNYRYWTGVATSDHAKVDAVVAEDNQHVLQCPSCTRLMLKYRIGLNPDNKVDLCSNCDEVWLDAGEWSLLKQLGLHTSLPSIITDVWQRDLRKQRQSNLQKERYEALIGVEKFAKCVEFKEWLDQQEHKEQIKLFFMH